MAKLNKEYIEILSKDRAPSTNFWELEKRIYQDKKSIGVLIDMRRSQMVNNLCRFIYEEIITLDDLDGFSDELIETIKHITERSR